MSFYQLVYVSDLANKNEETLGPILESALRRNTEDGITGMLLYSGGNFLQVLEGDEAQVHATYERICRDPRHKNTSVITEEEVSERHFSNWSMGFKQLGPQDIAKIPAYAPYFQFGFKASAFNAKPGAALELLELFGKGML